MPAVASLEELEAVMNDLNAIKETHPEAFAKFQEIIKKHRKVGYKNINKMLLGEATPKKLKGLE